MYSFLINNQNSYKVIWLILCASLVILMVLLGGITRLTNSGLSIVQWKPISGVLPPTTDAEWQEEFTKYKTSPEYQQHNLNMPLADFKSIFWIEFIHRLAGRITGLVFLIPLLYFYLKGEISQNSKPFYFIILILFGFQGFMGWYMVKSGLVNDPYVSHFRLAAHLLLAFIIYSLIFWQLMKNCFDVLIIPIKVNLKKFRFLCYTTIIILFMQVFLGGLVAGLHAGHIYNSFPFMGDSFVPREIDFTLSLVQNLNDPVFIQFLHRINAYILTITTLGTVLFFLKVNNNKLKTVAVYINIALILQLLVGVVTLLYHVPTLLALIHQIGAIGLLSTLLWGLYLLKSA